MAALSNERKELLGAWLNFAAHFPKDLSPPALPPGAGALLPLWRDTRKLMIDFLRSTMDDAQTLALRYSTAAGQAAWEAATLEITKLADAVPLPGIKETLNDALQKQRIALGAFDAAQEALDRDLTNIAAAPAPDLAAIQKLVGDSVAKAVKTAAEALLSTAEKDLFDRLSRPAMANLLRGLEPNLRLSPPKGSCSRLPSSIEL